MNQDLYCLEAFMIANSVEATHVVGGAVRDMLLKRDPKDWDFVTGQDLAKLGLQFQENGWGANIVGKQFPVLYVSKHGQQFEIAKYRGNSVEEDAQHRDFTVNAIYWQPVTQDFVDPVGGIADLKRGVLKFVGRPQDRVQEDPCRIFRFYRLVKTLGLTPDERSLKACRTLFEVAVEEVDHDRIRNEMEKMAGTTLY